MAKKEVIKTKAQLLAALAAAGEINKKQATAIYDRFLAIVYTEAKGKQGFMIPGIGRLKKKDCKARMGRNPATGEAIKIPRKTVVRLTLNKACKDGVLAK